MRLLVAAFLLAVAAWPAQKVQAAAPAFDLIVQDETGYQLHRLDDGNPVHVKCPVKALSFSVAPNRRFLILVGTEDRRNGMGHLYRLSLPDGALQQLTGKPFYYNDVMKPSHRELYSDVAVSPDSRSVAFTVHHITGTDGDDIIGLSGPIVLLDLRTTRTRILRNTEDLIRGDGCFINQLVWAADGRSLLYACEISGGIASAAGDAPTVKLPLDDGSAALSTPHRWWSPGEILFSRCPNPSQSGVSGPLFVFDLRSRSIRPAAQVLPLPPAILRRVGSFQANANLFLIGDGPAKRLYSRQGKLLREWTGVSVSLAP